MSDSIAKRFACPSCARVHGAWNARCHGCGDWGLVAVDVSLTPQPNAQPKARLTAVPIEAQAPLLPSSVPIALSDVTAESFERNPTGLAPFDAVLGGGLVVGSVVVIGGAPGCAKSTLAMQAVAGVGLRALIATGEETISQAAERARRIHAASKDVMIVAETRLEVILEHARSTRAQVLVIDSIQMVTCDDASGGPGSPGQVKECGNRLVRYAKTADVAVIVIGHVTRDSVLAGPRTLEHMVDVVLMFEVVDEEQPERILRCAGKNRFGSATVKGYFRLTAEGLVPSIGERDFDDVMH